MTAHMQGQSNNSEKKIKGLIEGLVEELKNEGVVLSEASLSAINRLLLELAHNNDDKIAAYTRTSAELVKATCAEITIVKLKLIEILSKEREALSKSSSGSLQKSPVKPIVKSVSPELLRDLYTRIPMIVDEVVNQLERDYQKTASIGLSRLKALKNVLERKRTSTNLDLINGWIQSLDKVILHSHVESFCDHCQHYATRKKWVDAELLTVDTGAVISGEMRHYPAYYVDPASLLEDVIDMNEYRMIAIPGQEFPMDNSIVLLTIHESLQKLIREDRGAAERKEESAKPYQRDKKIQTVIDLNNQLLAILRSKIEGIEAEKNRYKYYAQPENRAVILAFYLAKIKIYQYEAHKANIPEKTILHNTNALIAISEYIVDRMQYGTYHTWFGRFFDWLCECVNWSPSSERESKLVAAAEMFDRVGSVVAPVEKLSENACFVYQQIWTDRTARLKNSEFINEAYQHYSKTWTDGKLGKIREQYKIKM